VSSWRERLHLRVSRAEELVFRELNRLDLTEGLVTQKPLALRMWVPDFWWVGRRKTVFLEGHVAHVRGRQLERDEQVTDVLAAEGFDVLRVPYRAPLSKARLAEVIAEIQEFLGA
jgi:very-short-patch-repair endonuclease